METQPFVVHLFVRFTEWALSRKPCGKVASARNTPNLSFLGGGDGSVDYRSSALFPPNFDVADSCDHRTCAVTSTLPTCNPMREQVAELQDRLDQERGVKQLSTSIGARLPT